MEAFFLLTQLLFCLFLSNKKKILFFQEYISFQRRYIFLKLKKFFCLYSYCVKNIRPTIPSVPC